MTQNFAATTNPYASASLYVGDLSPEVTEATLFELFNPIAPVASIRVCRDVEMRSSLGYAYVNFHSTVDAERASEAMNFSNIKGRQCRVMWSQRDKQLRENGKGNVFVKNLHESIDNKTLFDTFSIFGTILSCKVMIDRDTGKSRGYGYVHYLQADDAKKAIGGVNGMLIADKQVHAEPFVPRQERMKKTPWTNVYIKHIPSKMGKEDLKKFVEEKTGSKINSWHMWEKPMFGKSACVNFEEHDAAMKGVEILNKCEMKEWMDEKENNKPLRLYAARSQKRSERDRYLKMNSRPTRGRQFASAGNNLYVKLLGPDVTDEKLRQIFQPFGEIVSAKVMINPETGQSRGFGFVCFVNKEDASNALAKVHAVVDGPKLYVSRAQKKAERQEFLASRARRGSSQRFYGNRGGSSPQSYPSQMNRYNYPRQQMPQPSTQMHPAQFVQAQMMRQAYPFHPMGQPFHMQMPSQMGMPMNPGAFGGFPAMRMPNPNFGGMQPNIQMQPQQPSNSTALAAGAVGSAAMRSGMGSVGTASQSAVGVRSGTGIQGTAPQHLSAGARTGITTPVANYSQPTPAATGAPVQHNLYASAGQTGVEPSAQSRPVHSFPSQMSATEKEVQPLSPEMLQNATAQERKRMIGERLFPKIQEVEPRLAGKITGMLLEMENTELLVLLGNKDQLRKKINEALSVLKEHHKKQSLRNSESQARRPVSQGNQSASNRPTSASNN